MSRKGPDGIVLKRVAYRFHSIDLGWTTDILECGHINGGRTRTREPESRQCWDCHLKRPRIDPESVAVECLGSKRLARKAKVK